MSAINVLAPSPQFHPFSIEAAPKLVMRASLEVPSTTTKVLRSAAWLGAQLLVGIFTLVLFFATATATLWLRLYSYLTHKSLSDDIEKAHIKSVSESLHIVLTGPERGRPSASVVPMSLSSLNAGILLAYKNEKKVGAGVETKREADLLAKQTLQIREKIERLSRNERVWGGIDGVRKDLTQAMENPLYQTIATQDCEAANFLQFVAIKLLAADGTEALRNYGKKCIGELDGNAFSPLQLADLMREHNRKWGFSYGFPERILYSACHPLATIHSIQSILDPLKYNAGATNPNFSGHTFSLGNKKIRFYFGPGPTGNLIFEYGVLSAYEKFKVFELRFNHQDTSSKSEYYRIKEIQRMGDENPEVLRHALLGFDTKMKNNRGVQFDRPSAFFSEYRKYVKQGVRGQEGRSGHSGFYIPKHLLSDAQVATAIDHAEAFCAKLCENNPFWKQAMQETGEHGAKYRWHSALGHEDRLYPLSHPGKARMAKMMQLVTDTYLTLALLYRSFDAISPEMVQRTLDERLDQDLTALRTSGACKQNIDRAIVENITLRLFFRWASDPSPLTQQEVYEIAGAVFGRAQIVDDRKIIKARYQLLEEFLRFVGSAPGGVAAAHSLLKNYRSALCSSSWLSSFFPLR